LSDQDVCLGPKADIRKTAANVRFSNRPFGVKHFQTVHRCTGDQLARQIVETLHAAERLPDAIVILKTEASRNVELMFDLDFVLTGEALAKSPGLQAIVHSPQDPFLDNEFHEVFFPRVQRTVCAVGLGKPHNSLMGTGFLVGPDLVMTRWLGVEPLRAPGCAENNPSTLYKPRVTALIVTRSRKQNALCAARASDGGRRSLALISADNYLDIRKARSMRQPREVC
jgi:hypothetical protein